jgi:hypothetical protein
LLTGNDSYEVEQENEQIISVPRIGRERFLVNDFEVNQPRSASPLVVNDIRRGGVAVRPRAAKLTAPEPMSTAKFVRSRFQHLPRECAAVQMFPKTFTGQLIDANRLCSRSINTKTIAIQHLETLRFPAFPVFDLAPKADRYVRHAKIQIGQVGQLLAVAVALLNDHSPPTTGSLRDRIDL